MSDDDYMNVVGGAALQAVAVSMAAARIQGAANLADIAYKMNELHLHRSMEDTSCWIRLRDRAVALLERQMCILEGTQEVENADKAGVEDDGALVLGWGVYGLTAVLPKIAETIPQNPALSGIVSIAVSGATIGLGWVSQRVITEYGKQRMMVKLPVGGLPLPPGSSDTVGSAIAAGVAAGVVAGQAATGTGPIAS